MIALLTLLLVSMLRLQILVRLEKRRLGILVDFVAVMDGAGIAVDILAKR